MTNTSLAFNLLIYHRERNKAIGIENDTRFLRGMGAFIRHSGEGEAKTAINQMMEPVALKAEIEAYQALAKRLSGHIIDNLGDNDIRNEGVHVVKTIDAYVTHLSERLEVLWQLS